MREATSADEGLLLAWANDLQTRAAGFHSLQIDPATHHRWLKRRLKSPQSRVLIGMDGDTPIGQVRLESHGGGRVEVGISLAPELRGRRLGRALLEAGLQVGRIDAALGVRRFVARIRPDNAASIAVFAGAGFLLAASAMCNGAPCLVYELALERPG